MRDRIPGNVSPRADHNRQERYRPVQRPLSEAFDGSQTYPPYASPEQYGQRLPQQQGEYQQGHPQWHADRKGPVQRVSVREGPTDPRREEIRDVGHEAADDQGNRLQESGAAQRQDGCRVREREWHNGAKTRRYRPLAASF